MNSKQVSSLFVLILVLLASWPVLARPAPRPTGPAAAPQALLDTSQGSDILVSTANGSQECPDVAYNPTANQYLVVWHDPRGQDSDIYGQLYSFQGVPLGEPLAICTTNGSQYMPAVAYNETADEYMVIWSEYLAPLLWIGGQRVAADGSLVGDRFQVTLASNETVHDPDLVYDPNADHYLAVWDNESQEQVAAQLLDGNGTRLLADPLVVETNAADPKAAYDNDRASYMVVFEQEQDIAAQAVAGDGSLSGGTIPICSHPAQQGYPDIVFNSKYYEYVIVWQDWRNDAASGQDIYGRRIDQDGNFADEIAISTALRNQAQPTVGYNPDRQQYIVLWNDYRNELAGSMADIYGQRLNMLGELAEQGNFAVATAYHNQFSPAVAYNDNAHQYLVVWADYRGTWFSEIHGQRLHWLGLPLGYELDISAALESHEEPAVVYNSTNQEYFVVWADDRDGDGDHDIWGQRYSGAGRPLESNMPLRQEPGEETRPVVAYNHDLDQYLVVWDDLTEGDVEAQLFNAQGLPLGNAFNVAAGSGPAVSYSNGEYLVVFESNAGGDWDILGRFVQPDGDMRSQAFIINAAADNQAQPALVYAPQSLSYLVVWSDQQADEGDVYGQRVEVGTGDLLYDVIPIATAADAQSYPDVTVNSTDGNFLVVWHDYRDSGSSGTDVYGQMVTPGGVPLGNNIAVCTAEDDQQYPYVNYVQDMDSYYVGWQDNRDTNTGWDIYGRWLNADGSMGSLQLPTFSYAGWQLKPAGAYNPDRSEGIVVWQDGRNGEAYKIVARLGVLDRQPPVARFTRQPEVGFAGTTFTFDARSSSDNATPAGLLLVRWDWTSDGSWDTLPNLSKVVTQTVMNPGVYTVTLGVWDMMLLSDTVSYPIVVLTPTGNTPPTATLYVSPTLAPAGSSFFFDASDSTDPEGSLSARWDWQNDGQWDTGFAPGLTSTHVYTESGDYVMRVEVRDDEGLTDAILGQLTVVPAELVELQVLPGQGNVMPGIVIPYWAQGWDRYDNLIANPAVEWSVTDPNAGVIDANGIFTAGQKAGDYPDSILGQSNGVSDTASINIFTLYYENYLPLVFKGAGEVSETEYSYDDGTMESTVSWETGRGYAVCFSVPAANPQLLRLRYYLQDPQPIEVHVWSSDTHTDLITPFQAEPTAEGWNDVDLSAYNLMPGPVFCAGFLHLEDYRPTLGVDTTSPVYKSYEVDGAYWEEQGGYNAMIRVVYTEP
ncbi:MAG: hypothetical protein JXA37_14480 [Chloroflexia bacterium]|nr:hypothetical protein [Chloroflexia bacterium]